MADEPRKFFGYTDTVITIPSYHPGIGRNQGNSKHAIALFVQNILEGSRNILSGCHSCIKLAWPSCITYRGVSRSCVLVSYDHLGYSVDNGLE